VLTLGDQQIENISSKTQVLDYVDLEKSSLDPSNNSIVPETDDPEGVRNYFYDNIIIIYVLIFFYIVFGADNKNI